MVVLKVFYVDSAEDVKTAVEISPSKRAVTKKYETAQMEILKYMDITEQYMFTFEDVLAGKLTSEQKELLKYILANAC